MRRVKICCTIGPASRETDVLKKLLEVGMDIARLNLSHGTHEYHMETIERLRHVSQELGRNVPILADLAGPRLRVGKLVEGSASLRKGEKITLVSDETLGQDGVIPVQFPQLSEFVTIGDRILIDDGLIELRVQNVEEKAIDTVVLIGGILTNFRDIHLPDSAFVGRILTEKDQLDIAFVVQQGVELITLPLVRSQLDVIDFKSSLTQYASTGIVPTVISKIERQVAIQNLEKIIEATDGIMLARGDLGIDAGPEFAAVAQKSLIFKCRQAGKSVIIATQMLDSMIRNPRPTRGEASDVVNAVADGCDVISLAGETASGNYPVEAVETLARIISESERELLTIGQSPTDEWSRSIEFPPEHKQAGIAILSYFGDVINKKYPDIDVGVTIEQKGNKVILVITTPKGEKERIEQEFEHYGLVVAGRLQPEEYLHERMEVLRLRDKLEMAALELRQTERLMNTEREINRQRFEDYRQQVQLLGSLLIQDKSANAALISTIQDLSRQASEMSQASFATILGILERGYSETDQETIYKELERIKKQDLTLFQKLSAFVSQSAASGAIGNYFHQWLVEVIKTLGSLVPP